jgi:hypothetical protein
MADITVAITLNSPLDLTSEKSFPLLEMTNAEILEHSEVLPFWEGGSVFTPSLFPTVDRNGIISGTVKVQGVLKERARVSLYFRKTGALIQSTLTDKNGVYFFQCGLNRNVADYYAVAISDDPFNGQVFDKLTPV